MKTVSKLKKIADALYSKVIRHRYADEDGLVECVTCGVRKPIKEMQNGHYISRQHNATRYYDYNCHPQDKACNIFKGGNLDEYALFIIRSYGLEMLYKLREMKNQKKQWQPYELEELIEKFKKELV